jgi:SAM-dependent methyltransferase
MSPPRHLLNPTTRFSNRSHAYHSSRPSLPAAIIDAVLRGMDRARCVLADIGAGTGLSSLSLAAALSGDSRIFAVEPNADMRTFGQQATRHHPRIQWVDASAEATGLPDASADIVLSATAFHWFSPERAPREIARILRPGGRLAVMATDRDPAAAVADEFHRLIGETEPGISQANIRRWYGHAFTPASPSPAGVAARYLPSQVIAADNAQEFDLARLIARAHSSSYWPTDPDAQARACDALVEFHRRHADHDGVLRLPYQTVAIIADRIDE